MFTRVVNRPIAILMLSLAAALFGFLAYKQRPLSLMPPLSYPTLTVLTQYAGAAPEEVEIEITNELEERLSTLEGLTSIRSRSLSGLSEITIALRWGSSIDQSLQRIYERLDRVELPKGVSSPQVLRYDPSLDPLLVMALSSNVLLEETDNPRLRLSKLRRYALEILSPILYQVDGVAAVKVTGGDQAEISVKVHQSSLQRLGLSIADVSQALQNAQVNQAGGLIHTENGDVLIRTLAEIKSLEALKRLVIKHVDKRSDTINQLSNTQRQDMQNGAWITLGDIADVQESYAKRSSWVQLNLEPAIRIQIYRQSESDMVMVTKRIKQKLFEKGLSSKELRIPHPKGLNLAIINDQASFIEKALSEVNKAIAFGGLLAILILYAFLASWRQTLIIAVAIPLSVILAFIPLELFQVSLNLMSLGGLALGVGMLVDNSVVVLESIYRYQELGLTIKQAAIKGSHEVGSAVFASTMTTIAVFAPVAFIEGFAGQIFRDLALTVVSALLASLIVALAVVPTLAAYLIRSKADQGSDDSINFISLKPRLKPNQWPIWKANWSQSRSVKGKFLTLLSFPLYSLEGTLSLLLALILLLSLSFLGVVKTLIRPFIKLFDLFFSTISVLTNSIYHLLLSAYLGALKQSMKLPHLVVFTVLSLSVLAYQLQAEIPRSLLPDMAQDLVIADLDFPVGTSLEGTQRRLQPWLNYFLKSPLVTRVDVMIGQDHSDEQPGERRGPHQARLSIKLTAAVNESAIQNALRKFASHEAGLKLRLSKPSLIQLNTPMRIVLKGQSLEQLEVEEKKLFNLLGTVSSLSDLKRSFGQGAPELKLKYDHAKLRYLGLDPLTLAEQVKSQLNGIEALELIWHGERLPLRLNADYAEELQQQELLTLPIQSNRSKQIYPLGSLVSFVPSEGPAEIRHVDGQRAAELSAQVSAFELDESAQQIMKILQGLSLPTSIEAHLDGQEQEMKESSQELSAVLLISLFLVFVVMATQFESLRIPLLIMGAVPLALIGVSVGLWITQTPLSVVVFVGLITLGGLVVNNAIVFIDAIQRIAFEQKKLLVEEVLIQAGRQRLRPILMTTLTTLIALVPMLFGQGEGSELRAPLALTLLSGLSFSTLLVLFVIPALYQLFVPRSLPHV